MTENRVPPGVPTGGQFAATQRAESEVTLGASKVAAPPRRPADPERDLLIDSVVSARGGVRNAERSVRAAEQRLARSFEFPPVKALAGRRVRKARRILNERANSLDSAERRLQGWDDPIANGGPTHWPAPATGTTFNPMESR